MHGRATRYGHELAPLFASHVVALGDQRSSTNLTHANLSHYLTASSMGSHADMSFTDEKSGEALRISQLDGRRCV